MRGNRERDAEAICERVHPAVFGALALYCGDASLAEELTQETMLRVWLHRERVVALDRPDRWALRVGFNLAKSRWRRHRVERRAAAFAQEHGGTLDPADAIAVRTAVAALPPRQRAAIVARYFADLPVADAANVLGCSEGTVKALTHQGVTRLRRELQIDASRAEEDAT